MKNKRKTIPFIAVLFTAACAQEKLSPPEKQLTTATQTTNTEIKAPTSVPVTPPIVDKGCEPPDCHINPPPQSTSTSVPVKQPETLPEKKKKPIVDEGCKPPDCHINPPPQKPVKPHVNPPNPPDNLPVPG
jgi:hypothetical protein